MQTRYLAPGLLSTLLVFTPNVFAGEMTLEGATAEVERLEQENISLKQELETREQAIADYKQQMASIEEQIAQLQSQLEQ